MKAPTDNVIRFTSGTLKLDTPPSRKELGAAAANAAAEELRRLGQPGTGIGVIFATGASQFDTLAALTSTPGLAWNQVQGFHMDEYLGIDENHPTSFRRYLRDKLTQRVAMQEFLEMDTNATDITSYGLEYMRRLGAAKPQLCLLGIGE